MTITKGFRALVDEAMAQVKTKMGMRNVAHVDGGFTEWKQRGAPTETLEQRKAKKPA